ncbi:transmembrane protein, putative (macronuclear) [Tetrahymena thermophila SB210]|uniref:Transmembrane protein, putative n=1 Tax=Tetrahymena thermophila (strain SB210) TaxID=312017 RepID=I7M3X3_TETTS|nr:transmembrane protein, putative [Tetrahymena thermophila SB210]EAS04469.1 transmembrane protein, putative [Tetrahymena thermophila SB210]|eukprot:XP_001024714.1 transmembrane protein, putative [Tetrahymena thermophila SB210]
MKRNSQIEREDLEAQIPSQDDKKQINTNLNEDCDYRYSINQALHQSLLNYEDEQIILKSDLQSKTQNNIYDKQDINSEQVKTNIYYNSMQIPSMEYPYNNSNSYNHDLKIEIPIPPPPAMENQLQIKQPQNQINDMYQIPIRDIKEIEYCNHRNPNQHLYITSPLVYVSAILLILFLGGLVTLIVAIVIMAIASDALDSDCPCASCCDSSCDFCDKNCYFSCFNFLDSCCESQQLISSTIDFSYYSQRQNRKMEYNQYQMNQKNPGICDAIENCLCCSCFDILSTNKPVDGCLMNKIEVYCTNCNSKLKEQYTGQKYICPSVTLGIIGFTLLGISIHFYLLLK